MQAAYDPRSRSRLQPHLQPMHSGRPPLRPYTVPAKTSFSPIPRIHDGGEYHHNIPRLCLPVRKTRTPPSPPGEKATGRQDQAGQSSTGDRAGNADRRREGRISSALEIEIAKGGSESDVRPDE